MNIKRVNINETCFYGIIKLTQFDYLIKREREREGVKQLLNTLLGLDYEILMYDANGKPFLKDSTAEVSISHSHDMLVLMVDKNKPTGIDIELIRDKVRNIQHKFLSVSELKDVSAQSIEKLLVYWAAKETLYKIYSKREVDFIKDLFISPFNYNPDGGMISGTISKNGFNETIQLQYSKLDNYILVHRV